MLHKYPIKLGFQKQFHKGNSFIEVLVALCIISFGAVVIMQAQMQCFKLVLNSLKLTEALWSHA